MDIQDYSQELLTNAREFKQFAFEYKNQRALYSEAMNRLTGLLYKANLHDDKAAFENKLIKLLATPFAAEAQKYIEQLNNSRADYKGWEMVLEAYKAQISAIQSIIKYNLTGELQENVAQKVNMDDIMNFN